MIRGLIIAHPALDRRYGASHKPWKERTMSTRSFSLLLSAFVVFIYGCKKSDSNPVGPTSGLDGTWKTNGIYVYMNPNEGTQMTMTLRSGTYDYTSTSYVRDSTGNWHASYSDADSGQYQTDESFIILGTSDGAAIHYSIEGSKLTFNSTADHGGIYVGSSNSLVGQSWSYFVGGHKRSYLFQSSSNGLLLYDYNIDGSRIDTVYFTYATSSGVMTVNWSYIITQGHQYTYDSNPYVGVYQIANNKLYIYGKPYTRDNDDYFQYELYRQ